MAPTFKSSGDFGALIEGIDALLGEGAGSLAAGTAVVLDEAELLEVSLVGFGDLLRRTMNTPPPTAKNATMSIIIRRRCGVSVGPAASEGAVAASEEMAADGDVSLPSAT